MAKEKTELKVEGMSCQHCVNAVKTAVSDINGVFAVEVDLQNKKAIVEYDTDKVSISSIVNTIEEQGYDVIAF